MSVKGVNLYGAHSSSCEKLDIMLFVRPTIAHGGHDSDKKVHDWATIAMLFYFTQYQRCNNSSMIFSISYITDIANLFISFEY